MWTFLISNLSVGELISVVGQLDGSCESHCGPFHHSVDVDNVVGWIPLDMRSAGLDCDDTCLHVAAAVSSCMRATLLPTNVFHLFGVPCIHVKTIEESVHRYDSLIVMLSARMAVLYSLDNNVAAQSSNLGMVSCFSGATFEVEHRNSHEDMLLLSVERMYRQAS
jgi:hypothetical protein